METSNIEKITFSNFKKHLVRNFKREFETGGGIVLFLSFLFALVFVSYALFGNDIPGAMRIAMIPVALFLVPTICFFPTFLAAIHDSRRVSFNQYYSDSAIRERKINSL